MSSITKSRLLIIDKRWSDVFFFNFSSAQNFENINSVCVRMPSSALGSMISFCSCDNSFSIRFDRLSARDGFLILIYIVHSWLYFHRCPGIDQFSTHSLNKCALWAIASLHFRLTLIIFCPNNKNKTPITHKWVLNQNILFYPCFILGGENFHKFYPYIFLIYLYIFLIYSGAKSFTTYILWVIPVYPHLIPGFYPLMAING